ncbi:hypothetical protein Ancab_000720 [Ancistrocladus abbreviatus]
MASKFSTIPLSTPDAFPVSSRVVEPMAPTTVPAAKPAHTPITLPVVEEVNPSRSMCVPFPSFSPILSPSASHDDHGPLSSFDYLSMPPDTSLPTVSPSGSRDIHSSPFEHAAADYLSPRRSSRPHHPPPYLQDYCCNSISLLDSTSLCLHTITL